MSSRRVMMGCGAAVLLLLAARHPSADITILTHDAGDPAPHRVKAAVDLGLLGFSVLVTWTGKHLS